MVDLDATSWTAAPGSTSHIRDIDEVMENKEANSAGCEQPPSQAAEIPSGENVHKGMPCGKIKTETIIGEEEELKQGVADASLATLGLGEVRSSLQTMSTGVSELVATVKDLLSLSSDSDSDNTDCSYASDGNRHFSWSTFKKRARQRKRRREQLKKGYIPLIKGVQEHTAGDDKEVGERDEGKADKIDETGAGKSDEKLQRPQGIILGFRECNFEEFKSQHAGDEPRLHCVDVLLANDSLDEEIRNFEAVVAKVKAGETKFWKPSQPSRPTAESADSRKWIRRIRINSTAVMKALQQVCHESDEFAREPMVFHRPFQLLVHRYGGIKEHLERMRRPGGHDGANRGTCATDSLETSKLPTIEGHKDDDLMESTTAVDELACFVEFMECHIMPDSARYSDPSSPQAQSIRYEDLWYLFKPGDLVCSRTTYKGDLLRNSPSSRIIFRVLVTNFTTTSATNSRQFLQASIDSAQKGWSMLCYYIDHNGTFFAPIHWCFWMPHFRGEKRVTELNVYPVSYVELDEGQLVAQALSDGATYVDLLHRRFAFYSGWTQTTDPHGYTITDASGKKLQSPEHIESDILVDYQETFNAFPKWKMNFMPAFVEPLEPFRSLHTRDDIEVLEWDNETGRTHLWQTDRCLSTDETEWDHARTFFEENPSGLSAEKRDDVPSGILLALLPKRVFAYAVLERRFVQLNIRSVRSADRDASDKAFEKLEINPRYKKLILAMVKSHFDKMEIEKKSNIEMKTQDLIRGKGKGVVVLLHGVPGVGKTATAEAVAQKWQRPLFPITCGDLGYTAETLEKSLSEIFRLAHLWGCILLLDEADVFITRREKHDLQRNALVSAFLRVLEYYKGIMFLTTNRAGVLDEAVKSRVHLNLYYDHLNEEQTVAIFKQHIQRLREIEKQRNPDPNEQIVIRHKEIIQFARDHFNQPHENHGIGRWNGRQIRNAFLVASSLVHYEDEDEVDDGDADDLAEVGVKVQKQLGRQQFELVAETTLLYDQYREAVHSGKTDDHVAAEREERATPASSRTRPQTPDRLKTPSNMQATTFR